MPMINFQCEECGEKFTELVNSKNRDKVVCPKCKSSDIKQIYEGKCNSLSSISRSSPSKCDSCPMGCGVN